MIENRWKIEKFSSLLEERIYSARLLGLEKKLVIYGGGNSSFKTKINTTIEKNIDVLYIKSSGSCLSNIEEKDFSVLYLEKLLKAINLNEISDDEMLNLLMTSLIQYKMSRPSVETFLHAFLPFKFIDHVHSKAILTLTNQANGKSLITKIYGEKIGIIPYIKPGLKLAQAAYEVYKEKTKIDGLILMNHGIVTFGNSAKESYEKMIHLVNLAEEYISSLAKRSSVIKKNIEQEKLAELCSLIRCEYIKRGKNFILNFFSSDIVSEFVNHQEITRLCSVGPVTPDYAVFTKAWPLLIDNLAQKTYISKAFDDFQGDYRNYLQKHEEFFKTSLTNDDDALPRIIVIKNCGIISVGEDFETAQKNGNIYIDSLSVILNAEKISKYQGLSPKEIFEVEFWRLQREKLKKNFMPLSGKIALITGGASGIGLAISKELVFNGASVFILDKNDENFLKIEKEFPNNFIKCIKTDVSIRDEVFFNIEKIISILGGIDILVVNAGVFPSSSPIEETTLETWKKTIDINLSGAFYTISSVLPWMKKQLSGDIIIIASKNVPAPGKNAAAYSASKAGLTQLGRVSALEAGPYGIRVNILHPHLILDTNIWSRQIIEKRAKAYNMSKDEYVTNNILKTKLYSKDVAKAVLALVSGYFSKTTGAQILVDGGSDRTL